MIIPLVQVMLQRPFPFYRARVKRRTAADDAGLYSCKAIKDNELVCYQS